MDWDDVALVLLLACGLAALVFACVYHDREQRKWLKQVEDELGMKVEYWSRPSRHNNFFYWGGSSAGSSCGSKEKKKGDAAFAVVVGFLALVAWALCLAWSSKRCDFKAHVTRGRKVLVKAGADGYECDGIEFDDLEGLKEHLHAKVKPPGYAAH